jgi:hypothetical protein
MWVYKGQVGLDTEIKLDKIPLSVYRQWHKFIQVFEKRLGVDRYIALTDSYEKERWVESFIGMQWTGEEALSLVRVWEKYIGN